MKYWCIFFLVLCVLGPATAQIRTEGSIPFRHLSQQAIEKALEKAHQDGRTRTNVDEWEKILAHLTGRKVDSVAFSSLRHHGYYLDQTGTKTFLLYVNQTATFYFVRVVGCLTGSSDRNGDQCELGLTASYALGRNNNHTLTRKEKKAALAQLQDALIKGQILNRNALYFERSWFSFGPFP